MAEKIQRWYPSKHQLDTPEKLEASFRQVLKQHYSLVDQTNVRHASETSRVSSSGFPPGSGPIDTMLLGLYVQPIDTQTLADGATLKWNKASGTFIFS